MVRTKTVSSLVALGLRPLPGRGQKYANILRQCSVCVLRRLMYCIDLVIINAEDFIDYRNLLLICVFT